MEVFKLFGSIFVDNDEANKSIGKTGKETDGLTKKLGRGIKTAGKWAAGIAAGAVAIGAAAFAMTKKVTGAFDDIAKSATKLGVSTDAYQEMEYWASQNGISHGNMEKAVGRLNQRIGEAKEGNDKYSDALTALGVDMDAVKDGTVSTEDAMYQSIQALSEMTNEQDKAALASELFGTKLGRELMPALQDGSLSLEDAKEKAQELGIVIEEDTLNAAEKFNDTWDDMTRTLTAVGQKILAELMPVFQDMMNWIMDHMPQIQRVFSVAFDIVQTAITTVVGFIGDLINTIRTLYTSSQETLNAVWMFIQETFNNIIEFMQMAWEMIIEFWNVHGEQLVENALLIFTSVYEVAETAFMAIWEIIQEVMNFIIPFVQEMLENIFEFWDNHGEKIMNAIEVAFDFIKDVIDFVMPYIQGVIEVVWGVISTTIKTAIDLIMGIIDIFASLLTGDWEGLWNAIKGILETVWNAMKGYISTVANAIKGIVSAVFNAIKNVVSGVWNGIKNATSSVWNGIKSVISGTIDGIKSSISTVFNAIKNTIVKVWNSIKSRTQSIWKGITNVVKAPINTIIGFINGMIGALNKISIKVPKVPKWIPGIGGKGGGTIGFNIPKVPSLDVGTNLVAKDGLAMIHEGEAVVPKKYNPALNPSHSDDKTSKELLEATLQQNQILTQILAKNTDVYLDTGKIVTATDSAMSNNATIQSYFRGDR